MSEDLTRLEDRLHTVWEEDRNRGLLAWNYGVGRSLGEAHVDLYRNRLKETESMNLAMSDGKSTFIIVRPESEDYPKLFKLSEDTARLISGTPIIDLHLTIQAIRKVEDFSALKERLVGYSRTLPPLEVKVGGIARMNVHNQQGRLWLLAEKTASLEKIYNDLAQIAREMGCEAYPYQSRDWLPHIKIVDLPENMSPQIKDPTFGTGKGISFTVRNFEWTVQKGAERWDLLDQFSFS
jgi:2'-5' RNA ligase